VAKARLSPGLLYQAQKRSAWLISNNPFGSPWLPKIHMAMPY
jgi:hypothetical protein